MQGRHPAEAAHLPARLGTALPVWREWRGLAPLCEPHRYVSQSLLFQGVGVDIRRYATFSHFCCQLQVKALQILFNVIVQQQADAKTDAETGWANLS